MTVKKIRTQEQLDEFRAGVREREVYAARRRELADPDRINARINNAIISPQAKDNLRRLIFGDQHSTHLN